MLKVMRHTKPYKVSRWGHDVGNMIPRTDFVGSDTDIVFQIVIFKKYLFKYKTVYMSASCPVVLVLNIIAYR